jgi:predicted ester cyclase
MPVEIETIFLSEQESITMFVEENKALVRKFEDLIKARDLETALTLFSPDYVDHVPSIGLPPGIEGVRAFFTMQFTAFPEGSITRQDTIAEGDRVVIRMSGEFTHLGEFMGVPPTGKRVSWSWIEIWRIADGKFVEHWVEGDMMSLMQQLGALPPMAAH